MEIESLANNIEKKNLDNLVKDLASNTYCDVKSVEDALKRLKKKYKILPTKLQLRDAYNMFISTNKYTVEHNIKRFLKLKEMRCLSGVMVISVITSPYPEYIDNNGNQKTQRFSCKHDCFYCPRELDENGKEKNARSYLSDEPTVARGLDNNYDAYLQFTNRASQYVKNGHLLDKIEVIVLGGTWTEYPRNYQESFIRDLFYAANTFIDTIKREKLTLFEEQRFNETANLKIIGITLEMRPDSITSEEVSWLRYLGCTRVQLGIQHTNDAILKKVNRGCYLKDSISALKILKDYGYKVDAHWMPDLPDSSYEIDKQMFDYIINSEDLQFDQWKIYPTAVVPWTKLKEWYDNGLYKSWVEENPDKFINLLVDVKTNVPEWIRINRIVRDIPNTDRDGNLYIYGGNKVTNLRQVVHNKLKKDGKFCNCIRCREIRNQKLTIPTQVVIRKYKSSGGIEYFISIESGETNDSILIDNKWYKKNMQRENGLIYGFLRLRLSNIDNREYFSELNNAALIRELHVYGEVVGVNKNEKNINDKFSECQHTGYGKKLMKVAEQIANKNKYWKIAVISGIGVKNYYRKLGYHEKNTYMIKSIAPIWSYPWFYDILYLFGLFVIYIIYLII